MNEDSEDIQLDRAFMALADPVRRRILARLSRSAATVNELAEPFDISKQAISRHIGVLEQAGLVTRTRDAQRRPVHLNAAALEELTAWIDQYRLTRERQYRQLDALLMRAGEPTSTKKSSPGKPPSTSKKHAASTQHSTSTNTTKQDSTPTKENRS